jgi:hypothetical protein
LTAARPSRIFGLMAKPGPRELALRALGVPGVARQYQPADPPVPKPKPSKLPKRVHALSRSGVAPALKPKGKRGRPPTSDKPWLAAGVSKATWFRRKKGGAK